MNCGEDLQDLDKKGPVGPEINSKTQTSDGSTDKSESLKSELSNSNNPQSETSDTGEEQLKESDSPEEGTQGREQEVDIDDEVYAKLTAFQRNILIILAANRKTPKGLEIKEELETYYGEEVNHGRLYPNLDTLAEKGLIEKIEIDKRSNGYNLTSYGYSALKSRNNWFHQKIKNIDGEKFGIQTAEDTSKEHIDIGQRPELTDFQFDILIIISGQEETPKGLEIKEELETYYGEEVNHGRLYPNLDTLAEKRLIEKIEIDKRSNGYNLTSHGANLLWSRYNWLSKNITEGIENISLSQTDQNEETDLADETPQTNEESQNKTSESSELIDDILNDIHTDKDSAEQPDS